MAHHAVRSLGRERELDPVSRVHRDLDVRRPHRYLLPLFVPAKLLPRLSEARALAGCVLHVDERLQREQLRWGDDVGIRDRKSTRLNSSHQIISYAVFCLKKKKKTTTN